MRKGNCPFCGAQNVEINKEHALPDWLRELVIKRKVTPDEMLTMRMAGESHRRPYQTRGAHIPVHSPCKLHCNGGWMSKLESRIKPILRPFVEADPPAAVPIGEQQCAEIAFWLLKTAMVWDFVDPKAPYFTEAERRLIVAHHLEFDMMMWLGRYTGEDDYFMAAHTPMRLQSGPHLMDGFAFTLMAGHLVAQFLTFRRPPEITQVSIKMFGVPPVELVSLWPPRQFVWPPSGNVASARRLLEITNRFVPPPLRG